MLPQGSIHRRLPAETPQTLEFPGFRYRGFEVPGLKISESLFDDLGVGGPAYEKAPKSSPLAWRVALYSVGMGLAWGERDAEALPEAVKHAGRLVYEDAQRRKTRGVWHKDAVLLESPKGIRQKEGYVLAVYFKNIEGFDKRGEEWIIRPSPQTEETCVWVPKGDGRFVVPTMDGIYNPVTGTPLETVEKREEAVERWEQAGLTEEYAERELSRFHIEDSGHREHSGVVAVRSWSYDNGGPMCIALFSEPGARFTYFGSFPARVRQEG